MQKDQRVQIVVEAEWFTKFHWSRQLLDPTLQSVQGPSAFGVACRLIDPGHQAGVLVRAEASWDGGGRAHDGFEILVPWRYVVAILEVWDEQAMKERQVGFKPQAGFRPPGA